MGYRRYDSLVFGLDKLELGSGGMMSGLVVNPTGASPSEGMCRSSSAIVGSSHGSDVSLTISSCWKAGSCLITLHGGGLNTTRIEYCVKCQGSDKRVYIDLGLMKLLYLNFSKPINLPGNMTLIFPQLKRPT